MFDRRRGRQSVLLLGPLVFGEHVVVVLEKHERHPQYPHNREFEQEFDDKALLAKHSHSLLSNKTLLATCTIATTTTTTTTIPINIRKKLKTTTYIVFDFFLCFIFEFASHLIIRSIIIQVCFIVCPCKSCATPFSVFVCCVVVAVALVCA